MTSNMHVNVLSHHMQLPVHTRPKEVFQKPASFHPSSISASAEHAKELATHDGSFLAIGLLTLFESASLSVSPHLTGASLHSPTPFSILFLPHPTPTKPDRSAGRVGLLSLPASTGMDRYDPCAFGAIRSNAPNLLRFGCASPATSSNRLFTRQRGRL